MGSLNRPVEGRARAQFERDGFHIMRRHLSGTGAAHYRVRINKVFGLPAEELDNNRIDGGTFTRADGVTTVSDFWPVLFNKHLLATVRELLGDDVRYTQHSDLHINLHGGRYHRDNACREFGIGQDWDEREAPYKVVRIAIYLSDHRDSGSSIVILPGSHRRETWLNRREYVAWNKLRSFARRRGRNDIVPHVYVTRPKLTVKTQPGDCIIFDQRLLHAGGILRGARPKYAIFLSYGLDNAHSRYHRAFFLDRPTYSPEIPATLRDRLAAEQLLLT